MTELGERLIVIPARGGSKRLPRKNVLPLAGKPLICWTIEAALATGLAARIMVTSDDDEILSIARRYAHKGIISHKRPEELATDHASTADALQDALDAEQQAGHPAKTLILLQPTSPLRTAEDILAAVREYEENGSSDTVVSVSQVDHPTAWVGTIAENGQLQGLDLSGMRSQDYQTEYHLNGAVYVASVRTLRQRGNLFTDDLRASVMPRERSMDIDEAVDFRICESLLCRD
ncbi:acylneuraminate cytidylyltransferase family protein [Marinobacter salarius]|uniref:acylneuraminate cytidylyltransferase family protein n=1 Tax=Marinobacter salarius TaxID=1420917 RepID=UPI003008C83B